MKYEILKLGALSLLVATSAQAELGSAKWVDFLEIKDGPGFNYLQAYKVVQSLSNGGPSSSPAPSASSPSAKTDPSPSGVYNLPKGMEGQGAGAAGGMGSGTGAQNAAAPEALEQSESKKPKTEKDEPLAPQPKKPRKEESEIAPPESPASKLEQLRSKRTELAEQLERRIAALRGFASNFSAESSEEIEALKNELRAGLEDLAQVQAELSLLDDPTEKNSASFEDALQRVSEALDKAKALDMVSADDGAHAPST